MDSNLYGAFPVKEFVFGFACSCGFSASTFSPALIDSDLPSRREIEAEFVAGGFTPVVHRVVTQVTAADWPSFIEKSALRGDSFLARLSDADFHQGMIALRNPGETVKQEHAVTEEISLSTVPPGIVPKLAENPVFS